MINVYDGNNVLLRALTDKSLHNRMSLRMRYNALTPADIWVFDGAGHNDRRRAVYPEYKMNRLPPDPNIFAHIQLFKELLEHSNATVIQVKGWEADDVINTIARRGAPVKIHTNDLDYGQIAHLPNVELSGVKMKDIQPKWITLYKALVGDSSDNIAGIPGFGPKTWDAVAPHREQIVRAIRIGDPFGFEGLPLPPRVNNWLRTTGNMEVLQNMFLITHFYLVPEEELNAGIRRGVFDFDKADALLKRYFL